MKGSDPELLTAGDALFWARERLRPSRTASLDADLLLGHVLDRPRPWVMAHPEGKLSQQEAADFRALIWRRVTGEPVAYLRGFVEWHGMRLAVTPDVLIPRPETELLLERAVELAREGGMASLADIGTGSGALAIGLAVDLPEARVQAVDISESALAVAELNAERMSAGCRIDFLLGDLADPLKQKPDLIVANLPYLSDEMMKDVSDDVLHEPAAALRAGNTGLELIERLLVQLEQRGWRVPMVLEIDPRQAGPAGNFSRRYGSVRILKDYAGLDRIVEITPET